MKDNILSTSGDTFQKFISHLTEKLRRPKAKFIRDLLCRILFSDDLILTHIASKVPKPTMAEANPYPKSLMSRLTFTLFSSRYYTCPAVRYALNLQSNQHPLLRKHSSFAVFH